MIIPGTFVWQKDGKMFNTAYVFYKGKTIVSYDKNSDGGDRGIAENHGLIPKKGNSDSAFDWGDLKLGIEICTDRGLLSRKGFKDRDLVFLISSGFTRIRFILGSWFCTYPISLFIELRK